MTSRNSVERFVLIQSVEVLLNLGENTYLREPLVPAVASISSYDPVAVAFIISFTVFGNVNEVCVHFVLLLSYEVLEFLFFLLEAFSRLHPYRGTFSLMAPGTYLNGVMIGDTNLTIPCPSSLGESCGFYTELFFDLSCDTVS